VQGDPAEGAGHPDHHGLGQNGGDRPRRRLEVGADDYVTKPFSLRELQALVRARLRFRSLAACVSVAKYQFGMSGSTSTRSAPQETASRYS